MCAPEPLRGQREAASFSRQHGLRGGLLATGRVGAGRARPEDRRCDAVPADKR